MTITGTRLGQYQVVSMLGVGGMGEVYLAQDTGLKRLVALKLISTTLTANKDRLRRFKQEAQAIAALNHPNIITLYEIGQVDNSHYIATEFINGETLRQHIDSLRIDISQAVNIALQVAEALLAAHAAGIVHRDIKPDNIMVRPDGYVKVLDFGLAKLTEHNPQFYVGPEASTASNIHTEPGTIIGTITYMSPEQLRGPLVDGRTDIWSLGVVLYEMVARCVPFTGSSKSDVIVSILEREQPPLTQYAPHAPTELQRIVNKALHKDKEHRFLTVKDLLLDIKNLKEDLDFEAKLQRAAGPSQQRTNDGTSSDDGRAASVTGGTAATTAVVVTARLTSSIEYLVSGLRRHQKGALILLFTLIVLGGTIAYQRSRPDPNAIIPVPSKGLKFTKLETISRVKEATISPDGKLVATVVEEGGKQSIAVRQVATARILQLVEPSEDLYSGLTFSPDGNYVLYLKQESDSMSLYQVSALGGASRKLIMNVSTPVTFAPSGKQLAFVRKRRDAATLILANREGAVERELATSARPYVFSITRDLNNGPAWSPDGNVIACPVTSEGEPFHMGVAAVDVETGKVRVFNAQPWYLIGRLAWLSDGSGLVMNAEDKALPSTTFQLWLLHYPSGEATRRTNDLDFYRNVSLTSDSGTLLTTRTHRASSMWVVDYGTREVAEQIRSSQNKGTGGVAWMPDGRIVYGSKETGNQDIWSMEADGSNSKQLTFDEGTDSGPAVSPDGRFIVFVSYRTGEAHIWRMNADGTEQQQLTAGHYEDCPQVSPDGQWVVYHGKTSLGNSLWKIPLGGGLPVRLTDRPAKQPAISPNGKFIAFFSTKGQADAAWNITITPFSGGLPVSEFDVPPTVSQQWQGMQWTPDGSALTYILTRGGASNIWAQPLSGGSPRQLTDFKEDRIEAFAWSPHDQRLICVRSVTTTDLILVSNFR